MNRSHLLRFLSIAALLGGCTAQVSDLSGLTTDREACGPGNPNEMRDLNFHLIELGAHVAGKFEINVINAESSFLASRIIYDPLQFGTRDVFVENAVPPGSHFVDFYGDLNGNHMADMPPADHTWRRPICDDGSLTFVHLAVFENLDYGLPIGSDFRLTINNIPEELRPAILEVHVIARFPSDVNQTVGFYRYGRLVEGRIDDLLATETIELPEILDGGTEHTIYYFFDVNQDGIANPADGDEICMRDEIAPTDASIPLDLNLDFADQVTRGLCGLRELPGPDDDIPSL